MGCLLSTLGRPFLPARRSDYSERLAHRTARAMALMMIFRKLALPLFLSFALAGCASYGAGEYPSLAIGDHDRVNGTFSAPPIETPQLPAVNLPKPGQLSQLVSEARAAHAVFQADAKSARSTVLAGRNAALESNAWARGQVALASLESARSRTLVALADLDRLQLDAELAEAPLNEISAARALVEELVESESQIISELQGR